MTGTRPEQSAQDWQVGIWNRLSDRYPTDVDGRFVPIVDEVLALARLVSGERVLDLGTGTGAVAERAVAAVGDTGLVAGVDVSPEMLVAARRRLESSAVAVDLREASAEHLPFADGTFDVVLSSLVFMFVIDRNAAARELARVLSPKGRIVVAVWAGAEECDIVRFQQIAGSFGGPPPVAGVGPGALAEPTPFLQQLREAGIEARVEVKSLSFEFPNFQLAWDVLAQVTAAELSAEARGDAHRAIMGEMYPLGDGPRRFHNKTQFIVGRRHTD